MLVAFYKASLVHIGPFHDASAEFVFVFWYFLVSFSCLYVLSVDLASASFW